jgi:glutamate N-acetyltransferase / amino-acid N-acetyltransferase
MGSVNLKPGVITLVPGFRAAGVRCGLKESGGPDLALIVAEVDCPAAAVFTTNLVKAAPVLYGQALLNRNGAVLRAVLVNAGNANACTGQQGLRDAAEVAHLAEEALGLPSDRVFVMSTGVIGQHLPLERIKSGIRAAVAGLSAAGGRAAAEAILTTDKIAKEAFVEVELGGAAVRIGGIAKGSGMIHPDLATMLSIIVTDANVSSNCLQLALQQAVATSFNRVTVDGDTSTNDTVVILASGTAGNTPVSQTGSENYRKLVTALTELCVALARMIARDGEGATKLLEITVRGARAEAEAERMAKAVATSPLVKTAFFGNDPNWGRILAAMGRSGAAIEPDRLSLWLGPHQLLARGEPLAFDGEALRDWLASSSEVLIEAELGLGSGAATVWTCDLTYDYVEINAEYHT